MKQSNYTAPRQMRDGLWTLGSVSVPRDRNALGDLLIAVIAVAVLALIVVGGTI